MSAFTDGEEGPPNKKSPRTLSPPQQRRLMQLRGIMLAQFIITCELSKEIEKSIPFDSIRTELGKARRYAAAEVVELLSGGLPQVYLTIGPVELTEEAIAGVHPLIRDIESINQSIRDLTQHILRQAPSMRSMWKEWALVAPIRISELNSRINPTLDAVEELCMDIMGDAYFHSEIMLAQQISFAANGPNFSEVFFNEQ
jgi:hypothetical protein